MAAKRNYIPRSISEFNDWQEQAVIKIQDKAEQWKIPETRMEEIVKKNVKWNNMYSRYSDRSQRSPALIREKDEEMQSYQQLLRSFFSEFIVNNSSISDADRALLGLAPRDRTISPTPIPSTQPVVQIDFSIRLQHRIAFTDSASPTSRAKPAGMHGCQIWIKLGGAAPESVKDLQFIATATRTPHTLSFNLEDAGQTVYYWLRWVNRRGQTGPWSRPVSAMVVG